MTTEQIELITGAIQTLGSLSFAAFCIYVVVRYL